MEPFARGQVPSPCSKEEARHSGSGSTPGLQERDIKSMEDLLCSFWHYLVNKMGVAEHTASAYMRYGWYVTRVGMEV